MEAVEMTYGSALREALREEMRRDPNIILMGEDLGAFGGAFKVTLGLLDEFGPQRVIDTPISENSIVGAALGAALMGMKPIAEIMYMDFLQLAMEQLVTQTSKARFLSGGKFRVSLVIRTQYSLGRTYGPQHTQFFPSWFFQAPGLMVVLPSTPADAKGLLKASVRANNPVLFIESGALYSTSGLVPKQDFVVELGKADTKRSGKDVTIVAISRVISEALFAAEELSQTGIEAEIVDPRTLQPLDLETIVASVRKTKRLVIATDEPVIGGTGAALVSAILDHIFYYLDAPVKILGSPAFPAPGNAVLEKEYMIDKDDVVGAVKSLF